MQIKDIIEHNRDFVKNGEYKKYSTSKYPNYKMAILSCMDTRLTQLLPAALGIKNGDAVIIKNAGGLISHPFGSVIRSLIIAVYELGVEEILVIGHTDCGVQNMDSQKLLDMMVERGVEKEQIEMINYCDVDIKSMLHGFDDVNQSVKETSEMLINHPLLPKNIKVYGFIINSVTGELTELV